jgi:hypothetical protein
MSHTAGRARPRPKYVESVSTTINLTLHSITIHVHVVTDLLRGGIFLRRFVSLVDSFSINTKSRPCNIS